MPDGYGTQGVPENHKHLHLLIQQGPGKRQRDLSKAWAQLPPETLLESTLPSGCALPDQRCLKEAKKMRQIFKFSSIYFHTDVFVETIWVDLANIIKKL